MLNWLPEFVAILSATGLSHLPHAASAPVVIEAPEIWSWHDKVSWFAGLFGLVVAAVTLWWFIIQTIATKNAAEAALKQANFVIASERAWILVEEILQPKELVPPSPLTPESLERQAIVALANDKDYLQANPGERWEMEMYKKEEIRASASAMVGLWVLMTGFRFKVYGNTPAKLTESALVFRLVDARVNGVGTMPDLPDEPNYGTASKAEEIPGMGTVLAPQFHFTPQVPFFGGKLSPDELIAIREGRKFLCAFGFVRYRDAFEGTPVRETRFCYIYDVTRGGVLIDPDTGEQVTPDAFRVGGPPQYNEAS